MLAILILAAGASSRMKGADKLLQQIDGQPLLRRLAEAARGTECPVLVTLPAAPGPRQAVLADLPLTPVAVPDAALGMAHSIRAGIAALPDGCAAAMILPADMPEIDAQDLRRMRDIWRGAAPDALLRATSAEGKPGHPVIFPARCFEALKNLQGDQGARSLLRHPDDKPLLVALPGNHALTDLDTPQDWARWRALRRSRQTSG